MTTENEVIHEAVISDLTPKTPTIEESAAALVKEGIISDDDTDLGALTETPEDASETGSDDKAPNSLDKFRDKDGNIDVAKLEKSYLELEKSKSAPKTDGEDGEDESGADDDNLLEVTKEPTEEEKKTVKEISEKAEVNLGEMSQEWLANGQLTEDHYTKLEAAGYPREMVDTYAKGLTSDVSATVNEAIAIAGDNEAYGEMIEWAGENLSEAEAAAFDKAVESGDKATVLQAVRGLHAQYTVANDDGTSEPQEQLTPKGSAAGNTYQHLDDYMADLNDPRYGTSEGFRAKVMDKLSRSQL